MRSTVDRAGRVVIPAVIRERAGLTPGSELEITADEFGIRMQQVASRPRLVKIGRRLIARPSAGGARKRPTIDIAALVEEERKRWL